MIPKPSVLSGGRTIGKTPFHNFGNVLIRVGDPVARKRVISAKWGASDWLSVSPKLLP